MNTRSSKEYRYIFTTTWKQASTSHLSSPQRERQEGCVAVSFHHNYLILYFRVTNFLFANSQNTTALHYRYDLQMYCTFVLFVNQHFLGLPASGTHCISFSHNLMNCNSSWVKSPLDENSLQLSVTDINFTLHPYFPFFCSILYNLPFY
jgi:hypothetical protein